MNEYQPWKTTRQTSARRVGRSILRQLPTAALGASLCWLVMSGYYDATTSEVERLRDQVTDERLAAVDLALEIDELQSACLGEPVNKMYDLGGLEVLQGSHFYVVREVE